MRRAVRIGDNFILIPGRIVIAFICINGECYMIDSGLDDDQARRALNIAREEALNIKALLNTHSHADHIGGNRFVVKRAGLKIYADKREIPYIQNPILEPTMMYGAYPPRDLRNKLFMAEPSYPDDINKISLPFEVVDIVGHSPGMIGFKVEDAFFTADAYLPRNVVEKHTIPYVYEPKKALETLEKILDTKGLIYIPSHGEPTDKPEEDVLANINRINVVRDVLTELIRREMTTEEIVIEVFSKLDVSIEHVGLYHLYTSIIKSYLSWLEDEEFIKPIIRGKKLLWIPQRR